MSLLTTPDPKCTAIQQVAGLYIVWDETWTHIIYQSYDAGKARAALEEYCEQCLNHSPDEEYIREHLLVAQNPDSPIEEMPEYHNG
jgi:hypothetical protein